MIGCDSNHSPVDDGPNHVPRPTLCIAAGIHERCRARGSRVIAAVATRDIRGNRADRDYVLGCVLSLLLLRRRPEPQC